ncbi:glycosyltransferase family A protein [Leptolyngbya sp. CCNP1308]|uniref:glycosyltransferase family 2 protein n=1 Tax=Leptolyngbya sp. CCNP1308 TaxID=3110255 RepID=UPI002B2011ED|nr:glycosyltransferase family A protein [Leptolyngbya sp. CCNP1308]MEA5452431.1 glycosyltransferase family A protein [Leptolyngbya sp. CCNP1308]
MKPLVSILIPCHNAAPWLAETLESALGQTWPNTEVILIDDGSTDDSLIVASQFDHPQLRIIAQRNQGAAATRNLALDLAQGEVIQFLDADDVLAPNKIEQQMALLEQHPDCLISGAWGRFHRHPQEANFTPEPLWRNLAPVDWLVCAWSGHWMMPPAAWLVPRSLIQAAGPWQSSLSLNDDGEYFARVILASQGIRFCSAARSYYRSGNRNSLSGRKTVAAWASQYRALALQSQHLLAAEDSDRTRQVCANLMQRFIYEVFPAVPSLRNLAAKQVHRLGGATEKPMGGPLFQLMARLVGWRRAHHVQLFLHQWGYRRLALGRVLPEGDRAAGLSLEEERPQWQES